MATQNMVAAAARFDQGYLEQLLKIPVLQRACAQ